MLFFNPVTIISFLFYFTVHALVLIGLVSLVNEGDELDMQSAISSVVICTAIGMGWGLAANYLELHALLVWLAYVPLAGLMGLVIAWISGIPVVRAMIVGALYVVFRISWIVCLIIVAVLAARLLYQHRNYAQSRKELRDRLAGRQETDDSD